MNRTKKKFVVLLAFLSSYISYVVYDLYSDIQSTEPQHWTDQQLIQYFNKYKPEFEHLTSLVLSEQAPFTIFNDRVVFNEKGSMSDDKIKKYRFYLNKLQLDRIDSSGDQKNVVFVSTSDGWFSHNSTKGYFYTKDEHHIEETLSSSDNLNNKANGTFYRHINGDWYLYYSGY